MSEYMQFRVGEVWEDPDTNERVIILCVNPLVGFFKCIPVKINAKEFWAHCRKIA